MYMSSLLLLSVYVHVIYILSGHIHIMCTLSEVVLDIFLPNRQYQCYPYIISSTLYIFYHVQLSFHTLSTQTHIVHVICMFSAHVHIICLSSLTLLVYPIIHNLVSVHCLHKCILLHVIYMLSAHIHIICLSSLTLLIYPIIHNLVSAHCLHTHPLSISSVYCLQMHMLCTSHFYCCYLHMYMSSAYYLRICILCARYLQWSLIYSFLTDNANVIHMSSLVLFIYLIMYNLVSTHCLHTHILLMSSIYCLEMHMFCTYHLYCCSCYLHTIWACTYYVHIIWSGP